MADIDDLEPSIVFDETLGKWEGSAFEKFTGSVACLSLEEFSGLVPKAGEAAVVLTGTPEKQKAADELQRAWGLITINPRASHVEFDAETERQIDNDPKIHELLRPRAIMIPGRQETEAQRQNRIKELVRLRFIIFGGRVITQAQQQRLADRARFRSKKPRESTA